MINWSIEIEINNTKYSYDIEDLGNIKFKQEPFENIIERRRHFSGKLLVTCKNNKNLYDLILAQPYWTENFVYVYRTENNDRQLWYKGSFKRSEANVDEEANRFEIVRLITYDKYRNILINKESEVLQYNRGSVPPDVMTGSRKSYIQYFICDGETEPSTLEGYTKIHESSYLRIYASEMISVLPDGHIGNNVAGWNGKMAFSNLTNEDWIQTNDDKKWFRPIHYAYFSIEYACTQINSSYTYWDTQTVVGTAEPVWFKVSPKANNATYDCSFIGVALEKALRVLLNSARVRLPENSLYDAVSQQLKTYFLSSTELVNRYRYERTLHYEVFEISLESVMEMLHQLGYYYKLNEIQDTYYEYEMEIKPYNQWDSTTNMTTDLTAQGYIQENIYDYEDNYSNMSFNFKKGNGIFSKKYAIFFEGEKTESIVFDFITDIETVHDSDTRDLDVVLFAVSGYNSAKTTFTESVCINPANRVLSTLELILGQYSQNRKYLKDEFDVDSTTCVSNWGYVKNVKKYVPIKVKMCFGDILSDILAKTQIGTGEIMAVSENIGENIYEIQINYPVL